MSERVVITSRESTILVPRPAISTVHFAILPVRSAHRNSSPCLTGDEAREAMTRRVYSEQYSRPMGDVRPGHVLAGIFHRIVR